MKKALCMLAAVLMIVSTAACDSSTPSSSAPASSGGAPASSASTGSAGFDPANIPQFLTIASSSPGGAWYPINVAHNSYMEELTNGAMTTRLVPGGSRDNVLTVNKKETDLGICHTVIATNGYNGQAPFDEATTDIRHLATLNPAGFFFAVRKDSDIQSIEDLVGKRIGFYPPGNLCNTIAENIFDVLGYTLEDLEAAGSTISYLAFSDGPGQLADNQIDTYICLGSWPPTVYQEIDYNPGIRILEIDDDLYAKLNEKYPGYSQFTIPAGTFQSFDHEVKTVGAYCCLIVNKDMTDDMAYVATKALWDNIDAIKDAAVDARGSSLETALSGVGIPVHPDRKSVV